MNCAMIKRRIKPVSNEIRKTEETRMMQLLGASNGKLHPQTKNLNLFGQMNIANLLNEFIK